MVPATLNAETIQKRFGGDFEDAKATLLGFARKFGRLQTLLAMHAALPLRLTPQLMNLIRVNFLPDVPWIAEADVLLSSLCRQIEDHVFEMGHCTRDLLVNEMVHTPELGPSHVRDVAKFLAAYANSELKKGVLNRDFLLCQHWVAAAYLDPDATADVLKNRLDFTDLPATDSSDSPRNAFETVGLASIARALWMPLNDYPDLADATRLVLTARSGADSTTLSPIPVDTRKRGRLFNVPQLPPHYVPRSQQLDELKELLLWSRSELPGIAGKILGLQGMGGIGKSVMAAKLVREPEIAEAFPDGIVWVTLGREAPDLLGWIKGIIFQITEERPCLVDLPSAHACLEQALAGRRCLIVLDDVWNTDDARWFECPGSASQLLITTRDSSLLTAAGATVCSVEMLPEGEALDLLAECSGVPRHALPSCAVAVAAQCGGLPLALALCGAQVRDGVLWNDLLNSLKEADLEFLDHPQGSVFKSIKVSVDALGTNDAKRYLELAAFPKDTAVPMAALEELWYRDGHLAKRHVLRLVTKLADRALLRMERGDGQLCVRLHGLHHDYVRKAKGAAEGGLACEQLTGFSLAEMHGSMATDRGLLSGQTVLGHTYSVTTCAVFDNGRLAFSGSSDYTLKVWDVESGACLKTLEGHSLPVATCVVFDNSRRALSGSWDRTLRLWDMASGSCLKTLAGHSDRVTSCVVSGDGRRALSGSWDRTLRLWDMASGSCLRTLAGHGDRVMSCAVFDNGRRALSGSSDSTLKVWDLESGACLKTLKGHGDAVWACTLFADGRRALSGSRDRTLKVWDLESGACLKTLRSHRLAVTSCVVFANGRRALSTSYDDTAKVWDIESGACLATFTAPVATFCCATTSDGRVIVAGDQSGRIHFLRLADAEGLDKQTQSSEDQGATKLMAETTTASHKHPVKIKPVRLFYSYSHKDEVFRDKLETHLTLLRRQQTIASWHDRCISAGEDWREAIDRNLDAADIILLLVSADFIASDYCYDIEMTRALARHTSGQARVIPVILRPVDFLGAPFAHLQALPRDAKPVTSWANSDEAWADVARGIRRVAMEINRLSRDPR